MRTCHDLFRTGAARKGDGRTAAGLNLGAIPVGRAVCVPAALRVRVRSKFRRKPQEMVAVCPRPPKGPGPQMPFALERHSYQVIPAPITDAAREKVWELCKGGAVIENRIENVGIPNSMQ